MCDQCGIELVSHEAVNRGIPPTRTDICCECGKNYLIPV
jgi:uncharacterized Zn finger protein